MTHTPEIIEAVGRAILVAVGHEISFDDLPSTERSELDKLSRAALSAIPRNEWRPIETAPKDGEPILIWKPNERAVGEYMMTAYWDDSHYSGTAGWVPVGGMHVQGYYSNVAEADQGYPTHWQPLPSAPE